MRKKHLKKCGETRTETFRGRLSPTEFAQVKTAQKEGGYESISDLLMDLLSIRDHAEGVLNTLRIKERILDDVLDIVQNEMGEWYAVADLYLPPHLWWGGRMRETLADVRGSDE